MPSTEMNGSECSRDETFKINCCYRYLLLLNELMKYIEHANELRAWHNQLCQLLKT